MSFSTPSEIAKALGRGRETQSDDGVWRTYCPAHDDTKSPSLAVHKNAAGSILVHCHAGCTQDAVIDALKSRNLWQVRSKEGAERGSYDKWEPQRVPPEAAVLPSPPLKHPKFGTPSAEWVYRNSDGTIIGSIYRFDQGGGTKTLLPVTWCKSGSGKEEWRFKSFTKPRCMYNSDKIATRKDAPVLLVEGEKTADAAEDLFPTFVVSTWPGGSKAVGYVDWTLLKGRKVYLWPDADEAGRNAMDAVTELVFNDVASIYRVTLPDSLEKGWDLYDEAPMGFVPADALAAAEKVEQPHSVDIIKDFNRKFAMTMLGSDAVIIEEQMQPSGRIETKYLSPTAFKQFYSNQYITDGRREVPAAKFWIDHPERRTYNGVVFYPGQETKQFYNLWKGFDYEPDPTGDWSLFEQHMRENVAQGDESLYLWMMAWFAQIVQHPQRKLGTSIALRGKQGTGKTKVGEVIGRLFINHYVLVEDPKYVVGSFNKHLANALLVHADEAFFAGDPRNGGKLRGLVTAGTQRIEPKGKDSFDVESFLRLLITSNESFIVPAAFEERRFAVFDVGLGRKQDRPFFEALDRQLMDGGYAGLLSYLQTFDLTRADPGVIPNTAALVEQKQYAMDGVTKFWFEALLDGTLPGYDIWPGRIATDELYGLYLDYCKSQNDRYPEAKSVFGRKLSTLAPDTDGFRRVKMQATVFNVKTQIEEQRRVWGYELPPLQVCRKSVDKLLGEGITWSLEVDEGEDRQSHLDVDDTQPLP